MTDSPQTSQGGDKLEPPAYSASADGGKLAINAGKECVGPRWTEPTTTQVALLESALKQDSRHILSMLDKPSESVTNVEAADALSLHSAFCLLSAACMRRSMLCSHITFSEAHCWHQRRPSCSGRIAPLLESLMATSADELKDNHDDKVRRIGILTMEGLLFAAVESFKRSLRFRQSWKCREKLAVLSIDGHRVEEAQSWAEFKLLAQLNIPTPDMETLSGAFLHGLLVAVRILPRHAVCVRFVGELLCMFGNKQRIVGLTDDLQADETDEECAATEKDASLEIFSALAQCSAVVCHLGLWQELTSEEFAEMGMRPPVKLCRPAIDLLHYLLSTDIISGTRSVFSWASCCLVFGREIGEIVPRALPLLVDALVADQSTRRLLKEVNQAVEVLVRASVSQPAPCHSILHLLVMTELLKVRSDLTPEMLVRRRTAVMQLLRGILIDGGSRLVNRTNRHGKTAAHMVISSPAPDHLHSWGMDRKEALESHWAAMLGVLKLFDAYGQHWDSYYGDNKETLLEMLAASQRWPSFVDKLLCQPRSLRCLCASVVVASAWQASETWQRLPEHIKSFVLEHAPSGRAPSKGQQILNFVLGHAPKLNPTEQ